MKIAISLYKIFFLIMLSAICYGVGVNVKNEQYDIAAMLALSFIWLCFDDAVDSIKDKK